MKKRSGEKIKLTSIDELLGVPAEEASVEIDLAEISSFKKHPFKVIDDEKMEDLVESIRENGVLTPVLVRPTSDDRYEMISGHRRMHAAQLAGLTKIPAMVREMTEDEATILMVDSNIQREELLPSEKAFAFKMKMDAMSRQGRRTDLTSGQNVPKLSTDEIGEGSGLSGRQVKRFIRLTELNPKILAMVDEKRIPFTIGVELSYLDKDVQKIVHQYILDNGVIKPEQVAALRRDSADALIPESMVIDILNGSLIGRMPKKKVTLSEKKLYQYFPPHYSEAQMEDIIEKLLMEWKHSQEG